MRIRHIILYLFCLLPGVASAQTLDQARTMFTKGQYKKAKPVFERYMKSKPTHANYNYWYGVCCLKTGEAEKSIRYLEFAVEKKIQNAPLYLGQAYDETYRFEEAVRAFETYMEGQAERKQPTGKTMSMLERSKAKARMLKGVEDVCVVDSLIVDKADFLSAYHISDESGKLHTYRRFFNAEDDHEGTVYETEIGNKIYYGKPGDGGKLNIFYQNKLLDGWGKETALPETVNADGNTNYPFVPADGITIYYASDGAASVGGYDIFVTRYNSGSEAYLAPENVGMPFNSPFNDYMYVVDEYNNLGWFATDRYQPRDKVCVYIFIPNVSRTAYNYEAMEPGKMRRLACLTSIEDTWKDRNAVAEARERLATARTKVHEERKKHEFEFVINDRHTYYSMDDFISPRARELFAKYRRIEEERNVQIDRLEELRNTYAGAGKSDRERMAAGMLELETGVRTMNDRLDALGMDVRNEEVKSLNKVKP